MLGSKVGGRKQTSKPDRPTTKRVFVLAGALGVCKSPVCIYIGGPLCPRFTRIFLFSLVSEGPCKKSYRYLAYFGGHPRYILPPLSHSYPLIADENVMCFQDRPYIPVQSVFLAVRYHLIISRYFQTRSTIEVF